MTLTSWKVFVQELKRAFTSSFHEEVAFKKLESYSQGENQSIRNFSPEVLKLCKEADPTMSETTKLKNLLNKTKPTIQFEIRKKKPTTTTTEFLEYGKEAEELFELSNITLDNTTYPTIQPIPPQQINHSTIHELTIHLHILKILTRNIIHRIISIVILITNHRLMRLHDLSHFKTNLDQIIKIHTQIAINQLLIIMIILTLNNHHLIIILRVIAIKINALPTLSIPTNHQPHKNHNSNNFHLSHAIDATSLGMRFLSVHIFSIGVIAGWCCLRTSNKKTI